MDVLQPEARFRATRRAGRASTPLLFSDIFSTIQPIARMFGEWISQARNRSQTGAAPAERARPARGRRPRRDKPMRSNSPALCVY